MSLFCKHCNFPLKGLKATACPECGEPFEPLNSATYAEYEVWLVFRRWRWTLLWLLAAWSLFLSWGVWLAWFMAWAEVGHMPGPYNPMPPLWIELIHPLLMLVGGLGVVPVFGIAWLVRSSRRLARTKPRFRPLYRWSLGVLILCGMSLLYSYSWRLWTDWPIDAWLNAI